MPSTLQLINKKINKNNNYNYLLEINNNNIKHKITNLDGEEGKIILISLQVPEKPII